MGTPSDAGKEVAPPSSRLPIVRGGAVLGLALLFVPLLPWGWMQNARAFALIPLSLLGTLFLAILWRLRKAPYKDGLVLAVAVGASLFVLAAVAAVLAAAAPGPSWGLVGFLAVFAATQGVLTGAGLGAYRRHGYTGRDLAFVAPVSRQEVSLEDRAAVRTRIALLRGAAVGSMVLVCAPWPPWRWPSEPVGALVVLPLLLPFLLILWRLGRTPRKDGLALALGTGAVLFLGSAVFALAGAPGSDVTRLLGVGLFTAAQAVLAATAVSAFIRLGYAPGDWKLLVRGIVDPLVFFAVIGFVMAASIGHLP